MGAPAIVAAKADTRLKVSRVSTSAIRWQSSPPYPLRATVAAGGDSRAKFAGLSAFPILPVDSAANFAALSVSPDTRVKITRVSLPLAPFATADILSGVSNRPLSGGSADTSAKPALVSRGGFTACLRMPVQSLHRHRPAPHDGDARPWARSQYPPPRRRSTPPIIRQFCHQSSR